jgi:predicted DNA-binding transcriptional regulator AlpA
MSIEKPPKIPLRRGLTREDAAEYVGFCVRTFDQMVKDGLMPRPARFYRRLLWDVRQIDEHLDKHFAAPKVDIDPNIADEWLLPEP